MYSCVSFHEETPGHSSSWAEIPRRGRSVPGDPIYETLTPSAMKQRSRWDETPTSQMTQGAITPQTPGSPHNFHGTPHGTPPAGRKAMTKATQTPVKTYYV